MWETYNQEGINVGFHGKCTILSILFPVCTFAL